MRQQQERIAVVVVHGMGNQYPMDTLRGFVKALQPDDSTLFSSPNRITDDRETRRLSFSSSGYDFYEYYWAHLIQEPGIGAIIIWALELVFFKKSSPSLKKHICTLRFLVMLLTLGIVAVVIIYFKFLKEDLEKAVATAFSAAIAFYIIKSVLSFASRTVVSAVTGSLGDVLKYTVASPENIACRAKIREAGIQLLDNLHKKLNADGKPRYQQIIVVGHSLGSIVAYDMLTSLFSAYNRSYTGIPDDIDQSKLEELRTVTAPAHVGNQFQNLQFEVFKEYKTLGNMWRISHFITAGSPLTHAAMLSAKNKEDFKQKKKQRELPTCPPEFDVLDKHFAYDAKYNRELNTPRNLLTLHHAACFAETKWTNIYFKNDWIGGALASEFGAGIRDIEVFNSDSAFNRAPLTTHTKYWDLKVLESTNQLRNIFNQVRKV